MTEMTCMVFCIYFYVFHWIINCGNQAFGCTSTTVQHKRTGEDVTIRFQARTVNTESSALFVTNQILSNNNSALFTVVYQNGVDKLTGPCNGCIFTGNVATGDLSVRLENLQASSGGTYKHSITESSAQVKGCVIVYILGVPEQPRIPAGRHVTEVSNIRLMCSDSKSTTTPRDPNLTLQFIWRVDNAVNPVDIRYVYSNLRYTLTINNIEKQDANKTFTCEATESGPGVAGLTSASSDEYRMNVLYGPDESTTTLSPPNSTYIRDENSYLGNIACIADCNPACNYKWTKPGNIGVSSNGILSLGSLNRNEAAAYNCTVISPLSLIAGTVTKSVTVYVIYGPDADSLKLTPATTTYTGNEGSVLTTITCSTDCYPACNYKWTKSGTSNAVSSNGVLALGTLNRNKAGVYTCTASNPRKSGSDTKQVTVNVRYGPDRCDINVQSPYTLTEGSTPPVIMCQSDCYPSCSHVWKNISTGMHVGSKGELQLTKVTRYDSGYYNCTCQNTATNVYKNGQISTLQIVVEYRPDVNMLLSTTNISEGNTLKLLCNAVGVPPVYNFRGLQQRWDGSLVSNTHSAVTGTAPKSSLHIPSLKLQDSGTYTCYVNNGVNTESGVQQDSTASVFIKVNVAPKIRSRSLRFAGATEESANIRIQFYSFPDIQTFSFVRVDGLTIENSTSNKYAVSSYSSVVRDNFYGTDVQLNGGEAILYITNLIQEDFSNYTLTLTNEVGTTLTHFMLAAETKPSDPTNFRYIYEDGIHIFTWVSGFNGGHEQTFIIQISPYENEEWDNLTMVTEQTQSYLSGDVGYQSNVSHLSPGKYTARLYSWNIRGRTGYVILNTTITVPGSRQEKIVSKVVPIATGVTTSVVVIVGVVALVLFIWRRKFHQKDGSKEDVNRPKMEVETELENSYYNLSSMEERGHYETLQGNTKAHASQHYESLQRQGKAASTYASLKTDNNTPVSSLSPDGHKIYENLKLQ